MNRVFHDEDGKVLEALRGMEKEYEEQLIGYQDIFKFRLMEILIATMRQIVKENQILTQNSTVTQLMDFIEQEYSKTGLLTLFSERNHFNPQYISRQFKKETGISLNEYIQKIRIEKSCGLLRGTDKSVREIAELVGYKDLKFFKEIFKRFMQMTPREYRKKGF